MNIPTKEEAKIIIAELLSEPIRRKVLIEKCIEKLKLPADIVKDRRPDQPYNKTKCIFGHAMTELLNSGILTQNDGIVSYPERLDKKTAAESVKRDIQIDKTIRSLLSKRAYTRKELLAAVASELKADKDFVKVVKADAGRLLNEAIKCGEVLKTEGNYSLPAPVDEPPKPAQQAPAQASKPTKQQPSKTAPKPAQSAKVQPKMTEDKGAKRKNAVENLTISDEEFVDKTVLMLETWYKSKGYTKLESKNIDGPDDGGIDGVIKGNDGMGYPHKILIQVKNAHDNKKRAKIVDVRAFCGVVAADNDATMGLFVTSGKFTSETEKLVKNYKVKYFKLIDGALWLKLANECGFKV